MNILQKMAKIEPCPVCNSSAPKVVSPTGGTFFVRCGNCDFTGPGEESDQRAIRLWNNISEGEEEKKKIRNQGKEILEEALQEYQEKMESIGSGKREQFGRALQIVRDHYGIEKTTPDA